MKKKRSIQSKNHLQCWGCGKCYSTLPQLAGHLSQCTSYRYYKAYGIEDAPYYRLPEAVARQEKWKRYWRSREPEYRTFALRRRKAMTRKIREYQELRGDPLDDA